MIVISRTFSQLGLTKAKCLFIGPPAGGTTEQVDRFRSLNLEHVSAGLAAGGTGSSSHLSTVASGNVRPAAAAANGLRHWFWSRKADRGFWLEGFPRNRLEAMVFDDWMEARGETLTACFFAPLSAEADTGADWLEVAAHYREQGLLIELKGFSSAASLVDQALEQLASLAPRR